MPKHSSGVRRDSGPFSKGCLDLARLFWKDRILVVQPRAVPRSLVPSPERGYVPWSVLFSDTCVATDPAFQEAGIQQLLREGNGRIVFVCLEG